MEWILHFSRITERVVDMPHGATLLSSSRKKKKKKKKKRERETFAEERERARRASREEVLFCARQKQLCRHQSKSKLEIQ